MRGGTTDPRGRVLALASCLLAAGCAGNVRYAMLGSAHAPGVDGVLEVASASGTTELRLEVQHLPRPPLVPPSATYVVWVVPEDGPAANVGELRYDDWRRIGRWEATTAESRFALWVTAERSANVATPSEVRIADAFIGTRAPAAPENRRQPHVASPHEEAQRRASARSRRRDIAKIAALAVGVVAAGVAIAVVCRDPLRCRSEECPPERLRLPP